jgi:hypothetical protein
MGGDEAGDIMDEPRAVRAVDEEGGGFVHGEREGRRGHQNRPAGKEKGMKYSAAFLSIRLE